MATTTEILLEPGEVLYHEGDAANTGYIIESGEIGLFCTINGARVDVERRGPGSIVGELSILTGRPRTVTVEAVTPVRAYEVTAQQIITMFEALDPVLRACIDTSISFAATLNEQAHHGSEDGEVPLAPPTLRDASALVEQLRLENDLVRAADAGGFHMLYQPIVDLQTSQIRGFEALMRWQDADRGFVPPDIFIAASERIGLVHQLTEFALMEACKTLKSLRGAEGGGADLFASVNISGQDIARDGFIDFLLHVIDLHDLPPAAVKLEVTETALIEDRELAESSFKRLRKLGFGISIDDFGTGYSNLGYLKLLPLTALKIDRAFAGDAHANAVSRGIVRLLVALGKELNADVIAEGLETEDDVRTLRDLGCRLAQGYYFHKPMIASDLKAILEAQAAQRDVA